MLSIEGVIKKVFGTRSDRWLKKQRPLVSRINGLEPKYQALTDAELKGRTAIFREQIEQGASLDTLLPDAFATVREVAWRTMQMRHYDVQLLGGLVLHQGMVAEMKTGEGKTLTATLPVYLNAISGKGAHVVTVNDYLASRDADWMAKVYNYLGLSVGKVLQRDRNPASKQEAYGADITYGTNNEFGFDYLRDNMKFRIEDYVQRDHNFAIVDEVDSILVDEARTPLIISGPVNQELDRYVIIDGVIPLLQGEIDYVVDEKSRQVTLTDAGVDKVESKLGLDNLYNSNNMPLLHHVNQALKSHTIFRRDRDYVVQNGKVVIVDENTGRLMPGRRWSDGLHQAVEAKEKLEIQAESQTYATITFQNYFRMYNKLAGMTGTADTEREEFQKIYNLDVMVVPTNKPVVRNDMDDVVYKTQGEKYRAILDELEQIHAKGQPVLVGTVSVEKSEIVSRLLRQRGIPHEVLNARQHEREAQIVAQAGHKGAVTISTNMAGRGTDIKLGGDPEAMALDELGPDADAAEFDACVAKHKVQTDVDKEEVLSLGGLYILGTERHESRRIDNQLRGRAGRQGDPGASRFYMALDDDLLRIFQGDKLIGWMERMGLEDDEAIEHRWINKSIADAQKRVEGHNFQIRKNLLEYDDVMNLQRRTIYDLRRKALEGENIREMTLEALENLVDDILGETIPESVHPEQWDVDGLRERMGRIFTLSWDDTDEEVRDMSYEELRLRVIDEASGLYEGREADLGEDPLRRLERTLLLQYTDQHWKDHLLAMDRLRDGIGLRGYGQRNPLLEYKREGTDMFRLMMSMRDEAVVSYILKADVQADSIPEPSKSAARRMAREAPGEGAAVPAAQSEPQQPKLKMAEVQARLAQILERQREAEALASQVPDVLPDVQPAVPESPEDMETARDGDEGVTTDIDAQSAPTDSVEPAAPVRTGPPAIGVEAREYGKAIGLRRNDLCPCGSGKKFKKCCLKVSDTPPAATV